jgi:hypothetical protein
VIHGAFRYVFPETFFENFTGKEILLFISPQTLMKEEQTSDYTIQEADKCPFDSIKEPKKNGTPKNNRPEPEFRSFEFSTFIQSPNFILAVQGFFAAIVAG